MSNRNADYGYELQIINADGSVFTTDCGKSGLTFSAGTGEYAVSVRAYYIGEGYKLYGSWSAGAALSVSAPQYATVTVTGIGFTENDGDYYAKQRYAGLDEHGNPLPVETTDVVFSSRFLFPF